MSLQTSARRSGRNTPSAQKRSSARPRRPSRRSHRSSIGTGQSTSRARQAPATRRPGRGRYWSAEVTRTSHALDLPAAVFRSDDPGRIARALKRSAEQSRRRKAAPFRSAMSMLTFYENRAGHNLGPSRRRVLERAKRELRALYGRASGGRAARH